MEVTGKPVAVGMPVARHPPLRSVREELPHTAPASGNNAKTHQRIRVADTGNGNPFGNQSLHPIPWQVVLMTPAPYDSFIHDTSPVLTGAFGTSYIGPVKKNE